MAPRPSKKDQLTPHQVEELVRKTEQLCDQSAKVREEARGGLISHFQHEPENFPIAADQERRSRLARKHR